MDLTEENNNIKLLAEIEKNGRVDLPENEHNKFVMKMMIDNYAYCICEDTVTGMHLALGKPHHAYQMNI